MLKLGRIARREHFFVYLTPSIWYRDRRFVHKEEEY